MQNGFYTNVQNVLQDQQVIKEKETQFVCDWILAPQVPFIN